MIVWEIAVASVVCVALAVWLFIATVRVNSGRARNLIEGMTPNRLVYRRLSREIREKHGR